MFNLTMSILNNTAMLGTNKPQAVDIKDAIFFFV